MPGKYERKLNCDICGTPEYVSYLGRDPYYKNILVCRQCRDKPNAQDFVKVRPKKLYPVKPVRPDPSYYSDTSVCVPTAVPGKIVPGCTVPSED